MASRAYGWLALVGMSIVVGGLAGGCPPQIAPDDGKAELRRFASEQEFVDFFKDQAWAQQAPQWRGLGGMFGAPVAADAAGESTNGGGDSGSYSTTNVQEEGVDESDMMKSNGTHLFIARGQTVRIVKATPPEALAEVGQIDVGVPVESFYLVDTKLIVLGQKYDVGAYGPGGPEIMIWPPFYAKSSVVVAEVDVANPAKPKITRQTELDGSLVASRLTGGNLYLVLTIVPDLPANPSRLNIQAMTAEEILPKVRRSDATEPMLGWQDYYRPSSGDGYNTTAVVTLEAVDIEHVIGSIAVMANAGTVYASTEALYTTDSDYDALNNYRETTRIHKFEYDPQNGATYVGSGKVPGRLLNQFSLGENAGYLRVATHVDNWEFFGFGGVLVEDGGAAAVATSDAPTRAQTRNVNEPYNAVYVLKAVGDKLDVVGSLEDIAPGEQLYSARFLGDRGFLVTFLRIDPLFILDLSKPTEPKVMGELKIPGYSDYLHPFGDDLLIGVGQSTRQTPWGGVVPNAVQLSLFNVSDWENPKLVEQVELGGYGSYSDVSWTHKAFTFMPDRGLLAMPVVLFKDVANPFGDEGGGSWEPQFEGVVCFHVTAEGFTKLGQLAGVEPPECYWTDWRRAAIIDDVLYAVSPVGVGAVNMNTFEGRCELVLTPGEDEPDPCGGSAGEADPGQPSGVR